MTFKFRPGGGSVRQRKKSSSGGRRRAYGLRLPTFIESWIHNTTIGNFLWQIGTLLVATLRNVETVENNDELLRKTKNEGRLERKQQNYNMQYCQLNMWLIIIRFLSVLGVSTEFVPDEYWQGTEVAHWIVYNKGYLTWEWKYGLRGFLYPCFLALPVWVMEQLKYFQPVVMILGPRFMQATITCFAEFKFLSYARQKFGNESGLEIFYLQISSWFLLYCGSRTLSNTMEMDLSLLGFYYLQYDSPIKYTICAALAFFVRPTAITLWIPICFFIKSKICKSTSSFIGCAVAGALLFYGNTLLDIHFYGRFVLPSWTFFQFNFLESKSSEFGVHPGMWYFYSALPSILGLNLIWIILAICCWTPKHSQHIKISLFYLLVFSLVGHKEIRFLLPIVPHLFAVAGDFIACLENTGKAIKSSVWKYLKLLTQLNLALNVVAIVFFCQYHQAGIKPAAQLINLDSAKSNLDSTNVWIMMPCYSVPVYTYLHVKNANYEFLTCSPPKLEYNSTNIQTVDFSEFNFTDFISTKLLSNETGHHAVAKQPDYVLTYDQRSSELISTFEEEYGLIYNLFESYYHTILPFDNVGSKVDVLRYNNTATMARRKLFRPNNNNNE